MALPHAQAVASRLNPVLAHGPDIAVYAGMPAADVAALAEAGITAAMVVHGTRLALSAQGRDPDYAVELLESFDILIDYWEPIEDEQRKPLLAAADWFYRAALHGRALALPRYGELLRALGVGPVEAGILTQAEWDGIEPDRRIKYNVSAFFSVAPYVVQPDIADGPAGKILAAIASPVWPESRALQRFAMRFEQERAALGTAGFRLPPPSLSDAELRELLCLPQAAPAPGR